MQIFLKKASFRDHERQIYLDQLCTFESSVISIFHSALVNLIS